MTILDLINQLSKIARESGDLEVVMKNPDPFGKAFEPEAQVCAVNVMNQECRLEKGKGTDRHRFELLDLSVETSMNASTNHNSKVLVLF